MKQLGKIHRAAESVMMLDNNFQWHKTMNRVYNSGAEPCIITRLSRYEDINIVVLCNYLQSMHALAFCCTWQIPTTRKIWSKQHKTFKPLDYLEGFFNVIMGCDTTNSIYKKEETLKIMRDWKSNIDTNMIIVYQIFFGDERRKYFERITVFNENTPSYIFTEDARKK